MTERSNAFPAHWRLVPLEECMSAIIDYRGKSPSKTPTGIPLITAKIVKGGRILDPDEFISPEDYEEWMRRGLPQTGDVVMTTEVSPPLLEQHATMAVGTGMIDMRGGSQRRSVPVIFSFVKNTRGIR